MRNGRYRIVDVPLSVPIFFGCEQISLDVSRLGKLENLNPDNHLRRSLDRWWMTFDKSKWSE